jgi:hypothetical protein
MARRDIKIIRLPAMSTPSWLQLLMASWKIKIICSPAMSAPSLAETAIWLAASTKKKQIGLPVMSAPLLAATADGELDNENYWLACNVCALVGSDRHSACRVN